VHGELGSMEAFAAKLPAGKVLIPKLNDEVTLG
jgi:hypothetical protein